MEAPAYYRWRCALERPAGDIVVNLMSKWHANGICSPRVGFLALPWLDWLNKKSTPRRAMQEDSPFSALASKMVREKKVPREVARKGRHDDVLLRRRPPNSVVDGWVRDNDRDCKDMIVRLTRAAKRKRACDDFKVDLKADFQGIWTDGEGPTCANCGLAKSWHTLKDGCAEELEGPPPRRMKLRKGFP